MNDGHQKRIHVRRSHSVRNPIHVAGHEAVTPRLPIRVVGPSAKPEGIPAASIAPPIPETSAWPSTAIPGKMGKAYEATGALIKEQLKGRPSDDALVKNLRYTDLVVVNQGGMDQVETVLDAIGLPYQPFEGETLDPSQLVFANCPGDGVDPDTIRRFVQGGGTLVTSDWALDHLLQPAFPGYVSWDLGESTRDELVTVTAATSDPILEGVFLSSEQALWWLEVASHPISILKGQAVQKLVQSAELGTRYGSPAVLVTFPFGQGRVYHAISHFYLQRTEERTSGDAGAWSEFALLRDRDLNLDGTDLEDVTIAAMESSYTSARLILNVVLEHLKNRRG